jgi:hypothetical protein
MAARRTGPLRTTPLPQTIAYVAIRRSSSAASIAMKLCNRNYRNLKHGGTLEKAAQMANHASARTTRL